MKCCSSPVNSANSTPNKDYGNYKILKSNNQIKQKYKKITPPQKCRKKVQQKNKNKKSNTKKIIKTLQNPK